MPRPKPRQGTITTAQAARHLGLSASTLEKMRSYPSMQGPPFVKMGSRVAYRIEDLDEWLAGRVRRASRRPASPTSRNGDPKTPKDRPARNNSKKK